MKALILVGGEATRLRPLTCNTPKSMVPVLNMPFLEHVLRYLAQYNIREIVLAQGHLAQPIADYFGEGNRFGVHLIYVHEEKPLGTAGAVKNAEQYLHEPFLVLNGDIFTDLDIAAMQQYHRQNHAIATIALTAVADPTAYGLVETTPTGKITRFLEKPSRDQITTNMINAGAYILEPEVLQRVPSDVSYSFERQVFPQLLADSQPVYAYASPGYWIDIGTPAKYLQLNYDLLNGKSCRFAPPKDKSQIGEHCRIHPSVIIEGPVIIGEHSIIDAAVKLKGPLVIGPYSHIHSNVTIDRSVIWDHVTIESQVELRGSTVADHCLISTGCTAEDAVIGDHITLASDTKLEPGAKIFPDQADKCLY